MGIDGGVERAGEGDGDVTLTIHWSKCDAPHTEVIEVTGVQISEAGFYYQSPHVGTKRIYDIDLADSWEVKL